VIIGLAEQYCNDFICTSSPSVEPTVRTLANDVENCVDGRRTERVYSAEVTYKVCPRGPSLAPPTATQKRLRIVTLKGLARGDRKGSLNDGQIPNSRGVRVHASAGYSRGEGNRRASRNGRVSSSPTRNP
jgi:hypothetical protein